MAVKRLHYYNQQFLVEADFTDEQRYHLGMRRRLNTLLHSFGIAQGLEVVRTGAKQLTVKAGAAIDSTGRELVLDGDTILDVSNAVTFPASATVFVVITYQESETDPSTATGAPGNTRVTEAPTVTASTTAPPADGSVVRLARFDKTATGDVPGINGDQFDGGVRQSASSKLAPGAVTDAILSPALLARINAPSGVASVDGVSNPGGNIDLVAAGTITLAPDNSAAKRITIGETHSARTDNPHATTAAQVGALAFGQYDLRLRNLVTIVFTQADASGAQRSANTGMQPRAIFGVSSCSATLSARNYGGGSVGFFDAASGLQRCFSCALTRVSATDWFIRGGTGVPDQGICSAFFFDQSNAPNLAESLVVTVAPTASGVTATLTRNIPAGSAALPSFTLSINLFCLGV